MTVKSDENGICVDCLRQTGADTVYVMPSHQYPTGVVMPIGRRLELLNWASQEPERYVIEDDYDMTAYQTLLSHVKDSGMKVYGKGIHGRHNDETGAIVAWFKNQYEKILEEDFSRKVAN